MHKKRELHSQLPILQLILTNNFIYYIVILEEYVKFGPDYFRFCIVFLITFQGFGVIVS